MSSNDKLVKVVFELPEPDMGVSGERMWAKPVGENLYELQNSPWHARNVNWLDVVKAIADNDNEWPKFVKVHRRSGHRTIHLFILESAESRKQEILDECNRLGSTYENADGHMYALDFEPKVDIEPTIKYLKKLKAKKVADWRVNDS